MANEAILLRAQEQEVGGHPRATQIRDFEDLIPAEKSRLFTDCYVSLWRYKLLQEFPPPPPEQDTAEIRGPLLSLSPYSIISTVRGGV